MEKQKLLFESGNELAAYAAKTDQLSCDGLLPHHPFPQIAEFLDLMKAEGEHEISLIAAEESTAPPGSAMEPQRREQGYLMPPAPMACSMPWNSFRYSPEHAFPWF